MIDSLSWDEVQHWATLLQHLPVAVIATDETGVVKLWTEGATQLFGWSAAEAIGRPVTDLTVGPSEQRVADDIIRRVMALNVWEGEFTARRRDGTSVDIHVIDAPILDELGTLAGIVGVSIDVSLSRSDLQRTLHEVRSYADVTAAALDADREVRYGLHYDRLSETSEWLTAIPMIEPTSQPTVAMVRPMRAARSRSPAITRATMPQPIPMNPRIIGANQSDSTPKPQANAASSAETEATPESRSSRRRSA